MFWNKYIKKTRKPHTCEYCGRTIPPGDPRVAVSGIWEGGFTNYSLCPWCKDHMADIENDGDSGEFEFEPYCLFYRVEDAVIGIECPACGETDEDTEMICLHANKGTASISCGNSECKHEWEVDLEELLGIEHKKTGRDDGSSA